MCPLLTTLLYRLQDRDAEDSDAESEQEEAAPASKKRKAAGEGTPGKKAKLAGAGKAEKAVEEEGEAPRKGLSVGAIIGRKRAKGKK